MTLIEIIADDKPVTTKDGKRKIIQTAYAHTLTKEGKPKPHPEEIQIWANEGYEEKPGLYTMKPNSIQVYNKKLTIQLNLEPHVPPNQNKS